MADHDSIVSSDKLEAIADAIREKTHKEDTMTLDEMPDEIRSISGGGGETPECGIVPTSWASNGFVLTADSYGDIMPQALSARGSYEFDDKHADYPADIDIHNIYDQHIDVGTRIFSFLHSINLATPPAYIGREAFRNQFRMSCSQLSEGLSFIGNYAFYCCYNIKFDTIPESIITIETNAFGGSNRPEIITLNYDENSTYSIGDIAFYQGKNCTCIADIDTPEEFNSDHWIDGYYPELIEVYDPSNTYHDGDVVYDSELSDICTCCYVPIPDKWVTEYCPEANLFETGESYAIGDTVVEYDEEGYYYNIFTCIKSIEHATTASEDSEHWVEGYYPGILGVYDSNTTYSVGNVVVFDELGYYVPFTCISQTIGEFDSDCWVYGYAPTMLGIYDESHIYAIGDVVCMPISDDRGIFTCVGNLLGEFEQGYYPEISGEYDDTISYNIGDIVCYSQRVYTCINHTSSGQSPDDNTYWVEGYYPGILGIYDDSISYLAKAVVYSTQHDSVETLILKSNGSKALNLLVCYIPDLFEYYDNSHTYHAGDIVAYGTEEEPPSDGVSNTAWNYSQISCYICISTTPVTGAFDTDAWAKISDASYTCQKIQFLGTPESVASDIFSLSGYNFILVPWEEGEGPTIDISDGYVIYGYTPES